MHEIDLMVRIIKVTWLLEREREMCPWPNDEFLLAIEVIGGV